MTINIAANFRIHKIGLCLFIVILILLYIYAIHSIHAAEIGGLEVVDVHSQAKVSIEIKGKTKEGINDLVTTADYKSHCAMYKYLSVLYPSLTIISEEQSKECDDTITVGITGNTHSLRNTDVQNDLMVNADDITVWIDPLDATKEYTEHLLEYVTTMVCIAVRGIPLIGVIHKPFEPKQTYWAWAYHGVSSNLRKKVKSKSKKNIAIIVSRSHAGRVHNISKTVLGDDVNIISAAGAGYKSLEVAVGNASAYVHVTALKKWDICAGAAIINALGGTVTSLSNEAMVDFRSSDSLVFDRGILATMTNHYCNIAFSCLKKIKFLGKSTILFMQAFLYAPTKSQKLLKLREKNCWQKI
ncbi:putative inositol monophosphatase 3 isoform X2 [Microplitis demolitor]|uniref:putative inositol monophosphatase 3 isoform X2 n=1 Tax=Microplitis demolitor TaxID=69319 RepID=UPI00235B5E83|nr:putative inositol monophosphatase 3 isoform X2 [Microplitis demolitor]